MSSIVFVSSATFLASFFILYPSVDQLTQRATLVWRHTTEADRLSPSELEALIKSELLLQKITEKIATQQVTTVALKESTKKEKVEAFRQRISLNISEGSEATTPVEIDYKAADWREGKLALGALVTALTASNLHPEIEQLLTKEATFTKNLEDLEVQRQQAIQAHEKYKNNHDKLLASEDVVEEQTANVTRLQMINPEWESQNKRVEEAKASLDNLLTTHSPEHPKVIFQRSAYLQEKKRLAQYPQYHETVNLKKGSFESEKTIFDEKAKLSPIYESWKQGQDYTTSLELLDRQKEELVLKRTGLS
ncbi:MAG: hypothetical protein MPJ24_11825, partial [Pirellulaceae bacterium]|nr:hypothetical protein [Pirellulaceae bacterium]